MLLLIGCGKNRELEEGDRNTFTWKGKLVKDCDGVPASNVSVHLEIDMHDISESQSDIVAEAVTDSEGNFSLTYKKLPAGTDGVSLYKGGTGLLSAPVNLNLNRDVSIAPCHKINLQIENNSGQDSLYLTLGKIYDRTYVRTITFTPIDTLYKYPVLCLGLYKNSESIDLNVQSFLGQTWDHQAMNYSYSAAPTMKELRKALFRSKIDSVPDDYRQFSYKIRGYPKIDTIYIEL